MRFIGIRHGQSEYNLKELCNDDPAKKVPLTALGQNQARKAAKLLSGLGLTHIYCSPLLRTVQTAEIINERLELPLTVEPRLKDIITGFDSRPVVDYMAAIAIDPLNTRVKGGESVADFFIRVCDFLDELKLKGQENVLLVAHEETLRVLRAWAEGLPPEMVIGLPFENCKPYVFDTTTFTGI